MKACTSCWRLIEELSPGRSICRPCRYSETADARARRRAAGTHATCSKCRTERKVEHLEGKVCWKCLGKPKPVVSQPDTRRCCKCRKTKTLDNFHPRGNGFRSNCKGCNNHQPRRRCRVCHKPKHRSGFGDYRWQHRDYRCLVCVPERKRIPAEVLLDEYDAACIGRSDKDAAEWVAKKYGLSLESVNRSISKYAYEHER